MKSVRLGEEAYKRLLQSDPKAPTPRNPLQVLTDRETEVNQPLLDKILSSLKFKRLG